MKKKINKILITTTSFPTFTNKNNSQNFIGGGEFILTEVMTLLKYNYKITVIAPLKQNIPINEDINNLKIIRFRYPFMRWGNSYNNLTLHDNTSVKNYLSIFFLFLFFLIFILKNIHKEKPDIIWANWLQIGFLSKIANALQPKKVPVVTTIRGSDVRKMPVILNRFLAKICTTILNPYSADAEIKEWIKKYNFQEIQVINTYKHISLSERKVNEPRLTIIGRLNKAPELYQIKGLGKNLFIIINEILNERPDIFVDIIGEGTEKNFYEYLLKNHFKRVTFTGWLKNFSKYLEKSSVTIGGASLNGVVMDTAPNNIPLLISKNATGNIWKHLDNCLVYDPDDLTNFKELILFALDNKDLMEKLASKAKKDLNKYALNIDKAAIFWKKTFDSIMKR
jgi:glycosyltransferase involved in cell wall biosynthesis